MKGRRLACRPAPTPSSQEPQARLLEPPLPSAEQDGSGALRPSPHKPPGRAQAAAPHTAAALPAVLHSAGTLRRRPPPYPVSLQRQSSNKAKPGLAGRPRPGQPPYRRKARSRFLSPPAPSPHGPGFRPDRPRRQQALLRPHPAPCPLPGPAKSGAQLSEGRGPATSPPAGTKAPPGGGRGRWWGGKRFQPGPFLCRPALFAAEAAAGRRSSAERGERPRGPPPWWEPGRPGGTAATGRGRGAGRGAAVKRQERAPAARTEGAAAGPRPAARAPAAWRG